MQKEKKVHIVFKPPGGFYRTQIKVSMSRLKLRGVRGWLGNVELGGAGSPAGLEGWLNIAVTDRGDKVLCP